MTLKKTCACGKVIDYSQQRCDECQAKYEQYKAERYRHYDKNIRDKDTAAFYNSPEWEKVRAEVLRKYKGLDLWEYYINKKIVYADTAHHIVELKEDWSRRMDIKNLFPLTSGNHSMIHKLYKKDIKKTQQILLQILNKWGKEYTLGVGGIKKFEIKP